MTRPELRTTEFLQPAADPMAGGAIAGGLGAATAEVVSSITSGAIRLNVPDAETWLTAFDDLVQTVDEQSRQLGDEARWIASNRPLGVSELSQQIVRKLADRTGDADGGLAAAVGEVAAALRDIHLALRSSLLTDVAADEASAERLKRLVDGPAEAVRHG